MTELTAVWMLGCVCGFFMGVTVAGRRRPKPLSLKEQALEELREFLSIQSQVQPTRHLKLSAALLNPCPTNSSHSFVTDMINYKQLCAELVRIADALDSGKPLAANQGQALDGYAALAAFRDVANRARAELAKPEPELPTADPYLDNCSKAVLNRARQIDEMLAVDVCGPGAEPDTCASSWFTSKLIANLEERISILESLP